MGIAESAKGLQVSDEFVLLNITILPKKVLCLNVSFLLPPPPLRAVFIAVIVYCSAVEKLH